MAKLPQNTSVLSYWARSPDFSSLDVSPMVKYHKAMSPLVLFSKSRLLTPGRVTDGKLSQSNAPSCVV